MEFVIKRLPKSEIEIEVTIPFSEFEPHLNDAARMMSEEIAIEGFRKGKAPYETVKSRVGEAAMYERAADLAVRKTYPKIVEEAVAKDEALKENPPIGRPEITVTKLDPGNEFSYRATCAHLPGIRLPDYLPIARRARAEKKEATVSDEEVNESIVWVRESRAKRVAVSRPAAQGDAVEIDFEMKHNGVVLERGTSRNHPLILGKGRLLPGFEDAICGMRAGQTRDFSLDAPDGWREKTLAKKKNRFSRGDESD